LIRRYRSDAALALALDFDGVMHPIKGGTESKFCRLESLAAWQRGRPSLRVLIRALSG
jgi:hypothetical protein